MKINMPLSGTNWTNESERNATGNSFSEIYENSSSHQAIQFDLYFHVHFLFSLGIVRLCHALYISFIASDAQFKLKHFGLFFLNWSWLEIGHGDSLLEHFNWLGLNCIEFIHLRLGWYSLILMSEYPHSLITFHKSSRINSINSLNIKWLEYAMSNCLRRVLLWTVISYLLCHILHQMCGKVQVKCELLRRLLIDLISLIVIFECKIIQSHTMDEVNQLSIYVLEYVVCSINHFWEKWFSCNIIHRNFQQNPLTNHIFSGIPRYLLAIYWRWKTTIKTVSIWYWCVT